MQSGYTRAAANVLAAVLALFAAISFSDRASAQQSTMMDLIAAPNPSTFGTRLALIADVVTVPSEVPCTGTVDFFIDGRIIGTISANYMFLIPAPPLPVGTYKVTANFYNSLNCNPTSATLRGGLVVTSVHDFNGDGSGDIVWRDTSGNVAIWEMNGTMVLNASTSFVGNVATNWSIVGQRDFNGDGTNDLLWRDISGNVAIWEMSGTTVLNASSSFVANVPANWSIAGTGDFNGDGMGDILWQDSSGNVAIWEMNGTTVMNANSSFVSNVPSQWSIKGTGDFDGDGKSDILWQDSSGNVAIWEMNGTAILNQNSSSSQTSPANGRSNSPATTTATASATSYGGIHRAMWRSGR